MKHFYLIYLLPCTLVSAKSTNKAPPFLSVTYLPPDDSSDVNTFAFFVCLLLLFFVGVGGGESVFHWQHRKKGNEKPGGVLVV